MDKLFTALLLLDLSKNELKTALVLALLNNAECGGRVYKIEQIQDLVGIDKSGLINALTTLEIKNVVGKLVFDIGLLDKKLVKNFSEDFLSTIINKSSAPDYAIERVGYHITDEESAFVYNPLVTSWKYPAKAKVLKAIKAYDGLFAEDSAVQTFVTSLKGKVKNGKKSANANINGWEIHGSIQLFVKKYKEYYNANYLVDKKLEYRLMKNVLTILSSNNVATEKLEKFFDYALNKGKGKKKPVHISSLKYYANEFVTNVVTKDVATSDYYYDEKGRLHRK